MFVGAHQRTSERQLQRKSNLVAMLPLCHPARETCAGLAVLEGLNAQWSGLYFITESWQGDDS